MCGESKVIVGTLISGCLYNANYGCIVASCPFGEGLSKRGRWLLRLTRCVLPVLPGSQPIYTMYGMKREFLFRVSHLDVADLVSSLHTRTQTSSGMSSRGERVFWAPEACCSQHKGTS